ncbi:MAG: family N-acetyltransferase [Caulobacteraceae bacterium]|nr:family N-acetyltransferase [Caulobacteraceae bacterium]
MTQVRLFDPLTASRADWAGCASADRLYIQAFANGSRPLIANLSTTVLALRCGERVMPVTVNQSEYGGAYVCLPHTAYALYAKAELDLVEAGQARPALAVLADLAGGLMRLGQLNRIVHINNFILSTNLYDGWNGEGLGAIRRLLVERFPGHILAFRSLNSWSDPQLEPAFRADGWRLLPSRQVYVTDQMERQWTRRRDARRDLSLLADTPLSLDRLEKLQPGDATRISQLYGLLYLGKYSGLNPDFTPAFIEMTHASGFLRYRGLRAGEGALVAVVGCLARGGVLTAPVVGYDTAAPQSAALYRLTAAMTARMAIEENLRLNGSAGAAGFKRNRGARGVIEQTAMYVDHLPAFRRGVVGLLEQTLKRVVQPLMVERGL